SPQISSLPTGFLEFVLAGCEGLRRWLLRFTYTDGWIDTHTAAARRSDVCSFFSSSPDALDYTEKWLEDTVRHLRAGGGAAGAAGAAASCPPPLSPLHVHNQAYLLLLKWDHESVPFPETVLMDQVRFRQMQQEVERLVLLSSVLLLVSSSLGDELSSRPGLMENMKTTVSVLLEELHTPGFNLEEALLSIGHRVCEDLRGSGSSGSSGFSGFSEQGAELLRGRISACSRPENTVRQLMDSRVQVFLLGSLETRAPPPLPGGLAPVGRELQELAVRFSRLVNFNKLVFSPFYQRILQSLLRPGT
uniref:T-complex 11, testis-specific-like 1 n=1 Tax=Salarias fasciatus TaxID=181472 RepID=A0A672I4T4_SALFA